MDHKHYTNIEHGHGIDDPGHNHGYTMSGNATSAPLSAQSGGDFPRVVFANYTTATQDNSTGISVRYLGATWRDSTEARTLSDGNVGRPNTDSNDSTATETRPINFTVKIWKRIA